MATHQHLRPLRRRLAQDRDPPRRRRAPARRARVARCADAGDGASARRSSSASTSGIRTAPRSRSSSRTTTSAASTRRPRSPSSSGSRASASRSRSRPAGATGPRRWTWTRSRPRRSGASTAPSGRAPSTWRRSSRRTPRRGCRRSGSTGATCRTRATAAIPADVQEKILRFARAGLAAAIMRGKSYLSLGGVSMGIAGSIVDQPFFEQYLGMRVETVDMSEFIRRMEEGIFDPDEFERGARVGEGELPGGRGPQRRRQGEEPRGAGPRLGGRRPDGAHHARPDGGQSAAGRARLRRGGDGPQRDPRRLPGPAPVDRPQPQRRLHGGDPQLQLRLERHPRPAHLRDRERRAQRRDDAARVPAHQPGPDLRRRPDLLEPGRGRAGHRAPARGPGGRRLHPPDQLRRGDARRHRRDDRRRRARRR